MKKGIVIGIIIGAIVFGSIGVYATAHILSKDISYTKKDGSTTSVQDAINELYENKGNIIIEKRTNNRNSGVQTYTIEHDSENVTLISGQTSLEYSINSEGTFHKLDAIDSDGNGYGLYSKTLSLKTGDVIKFKRDSSGSYSYFIIY